MNDLLNNALRSPSVENISAHLYEVPGTFLENYETLFLLYWGYGKICLFGVSQSQNWQLTGNEAHLILHIRTSELKYSSLLTGKFLATCLTLCYVKLSDGWTKPGRLPVRPTDKFEYAYRLKIGSDVLRGGSSDASLLRDACSGKQACCEIRQSISTAMKRHRLDMNAVTLQP
jgi:hypothetical protein